MDLTDSLLSPDIAQPLRDCLLGSDLVFVPRLAESYRRRGRPFLGRFLTENELAYCEAGARIRESILIQKAAGRIAVKEAVSKALGCGLNGLGWGAGVEWREIEVVSQNQSPPALKLHGRALEISNRLGVRGWRLSLSHDGDYALATVIGLV